MTVSKLLSKLRGQQSGWPQDVIEIAAEHGYLDMVKYFCGIGDQVSRCEHNALVIAAKRGHFEVVKFLHSNRSRGCTRFIAPGAVMVQATQMDHIDVVRFLVENYYDDCTKSVTSYRVVHDILRGGRFEVWKCLYAKYGISWHFDIQFLFGKLR